MQDVETKEKEELLKDLQLRADKLQKEKESAIKTLNQEIHSLGEKKSQLEDEINTLQEQAQSIPTTPEPDTLIASKQMASFFSVTQKNAEEYLSKIKSIADEDAARDREQAKKILSEAQAEAKKIIAVAKQEVTDMKFMQDKESRSVQEQNNFLIKVAKEDADKYKLEVQRLAEDLYHKAKTEYDESQALASAILVEARNEAAHIIDEANFKLELTQKKSQNVVDRTEEKVARVIDSIKIEYQRLLDMMQGNTAQYMELCQSISNYKNEDSADFDLTSHDA